MKSTNEVQHNDQTYCLTPDVTEEKIKACILKTSVKGNYVNPNSPELERHCFICDDETQCLELANKKLKDITGNEDKKFELN